VVARLDGEDITILEVNAELAGAQIPPGMSRKDAEKAALQNIVLRRMMMNMAKERKIDQSPQFKLQERRMGEQLLVQALASDIAQKVPQPTREETDKFIAEHPEMFAERTIYEVDQIQFARPADLAALPLAQAKTMEAVQQVLQEAGIQYRRVDSKLDLVGANPRFVKEVTALIKRDPNELFMFPAPVGNGQIMLVNQVRSSSVVPFTGERAREYAKTVLRQLNVQEALSKAVKTQQDAAKKLVTYQKGYEPPKTPAGAPALPGITGETQAAGAAPGTATAAAPGAAPPAGAVPAVPPAATADAAPVPAPAQ
jgi:EpsD family peptidyl-prolyl cis-trans isomerase